MDKILKFFCFWNTSIPALIYNLKSIENLNNFDYGGLNLEVNIKVKQLIISSFKNNHNKHGRVSIHYITSIIQNIAIFPKWKLSVRSHIVLLLK